VSDVYALVRTLRDSRLSRNRNFELHATEEGMAARRVARFLRGVERDLFRAADARLEPAPSGDGYVLTLAFPEVRLRRMVALTAGEHRLLTEAPAVRERLERIP
jgi:hypothetical protein